MMSIFMNQGKQTISSLLWIMVFFCSSAGATTQPVNVLAWWGYLSQPGLKTQIEKKCSVSLSYDEYYSNNEFLRRRKGRVNHDIWIFSDTIYPAVEKSIKGTGSSLGNMVSHYPSAIRKQHRIMGYPNNVAYFILSLSGFLWNPPVIDLKADDSVTSIFKKAGTNLVLLLDDHIEVGKLIANQTQNYPSGKYRYADVEKGSEAFKKLIRNSNTLITNNLDSAALAHNFAFAYTWSGEAYERMYTSGKKGRKLKFLLHPQLSYITSDMVALVSKSPSALCVAKHLASRKFIDQIQNKTFYFSPYGKLGKVKAPEFVSLHKDFFSKLNKLPWLCAFSKEEFEKSEKLWQQIKLQVRQAKK